MAKRKKPKAGARAADEAARENLNGAKFMIRQLAREAANGKEWAVERLFEWLTDYPELRALVRELEELPDRVERAWVARVGGETEFARKGVVDYLAAMKAEMLGPVPSVTDKIMAASVLVAHLAHQQAALAAATAPAPELRAAYERILTAAQKRLQDAVRGWALYCAKQAAGHRPPGKIPLFEPGTTQGPPVDGRPKTCRQPRTRGTRPDAAGRPRQGRPARPGAGRDTP